MRKSARRRVACESLENRLLFFTYQVTGTNGSDAISLSIVGNSIISAVNGVSDSASDIINNKIEINALGGNDTISISTNGNNWMTINAGSGDDTINFSPGERNLESFEELKLITVNGDGNNDTLIYFDDNADSQGYGVSNGVTGRTGGARAIPNVESVVIRAGSGENYFTFDDPSPFAISVRGGADYDSLILFGATGDSGSYLPSATTPGSGSVSINGSSIDFQGIDSINPRDFSFFNFTTPGANDSLLLSSGSYIVGTSGGVEFAPLTSSNLGFLTVDMGLHDGVTGNDTLTSFGVQDAGSGIRLNAGTGSNTLTNSGTYRIDTGLGTTLGTNLTIKNSGTLTFDGAQQLKRLELNTGSVARFINGIGTMLTAKELAVAFGSGTIDLAQNQNATVPVTGSFSIGAGGSLVKKGTGAVSVFGSQAHGVGAVLDVLGGVFNLHSDAGSASSRPLNLLTEGGTINLGATQHVNSVDAEFGRVTMLTHGSRVLVTNSVTVDAEGPGIIDLRDNDMIVDYLSSAESVAVQDLLYSGRANGAWDGIGIQSSAAAGNPGHITTLGSLEATDFKSIYSATTTFDGQSLDNTALLIKYTYYGDVDFNGRVDLVDYNRMRPGAPGGWLNGDFDDNGIVDAADTALIDAAFIGQGPVL